ncbi:MAG: HAD family hydrolase [Proteobacteria bacterium]|nr:HAD family hydrolase [Pseudomonadota bacterium]
MKKKEHNSAAVFLDRDGTINVDTGYMSDPEALELLPGAAAAIKELNLKRIPVVVVSNQSAVARGYATEEQVESVNARLIELLDAEDAYLDALYFCAHHPDDGCVCRKPAPGLIDSASEKHSIDTARSYVVGDKRSDMELARAVGATAVMVMTGLGEVELKRSEKAPDFAAADLGKAVKWILAQMENETA